MIILGIDPGSRTTGFGIISFDEKRYTYVASGCVRVGHLPMVERLQEIYRAIQEVIETYQPTAGAIEQIFMHKGADSALKLGQARGVAMLAMANVGLSVAEYAARQVKQAVVGYGAADKIQVQRMMQALLNLPLSVPADAADALAIAICHANTQQGLRRLGHGHLMSHHRLK